MAKERCMEEQIDWRSCHTRFAAWREAPPEKCEGQADKESHVHFEHKPSPPSRRLACVDWRAHVPCACGAWFLVVVQ